MTAAIREAPEPFTPDMKVDEAEAKIADSDLESMARRRRGWSHWNGARERHRGGDGRRSAPGNDRDDNEARAQRRRRRQNGQSPRSRRPAAGIGAGADGRHGPQRAARSSVGGTRASCWESWHCRISFAHMASRAPTSSPRTPLASEPLASGAPTVSYTPPQRPALGADSDRAGISRNAWDNLRRDCGVGAS